MPNYQNSQIYKLVSNMTSDIYIGSCLMRLSTRLSNHKSKDNKCASKKLFVDDAIVTIVLIENFACNTKNELKARELHHITTNNCINVNKPFVCEIPFGDGKEWNKEYMKEYKAINAEQIKLKKKEYNAINAEQIKSKTKEYYAINAEQIKSKAKEYNVINAEKIKSKAKEYYAINAEQIKSKTKEYKAINSEQIKSKTKEYYAINAEQIKSKTKEYNAINAEHIKEYRASHKDQINANRRARYAKKKLALNLENTLNKNIIV